MLRITQLTKTFPGQSEQTLKGIDLHVMPGQFCVILGNNGSGKSTFMRVLSGEHSAESGRLLIAGSDMTRACRAEVIASVVQDVNAGTVGSLTMLENIVLSLGRGKDGTFATYKKEVEAVEALVARLGIGLERFLHAPMSALSGGQRQMVATLMAIHSKPRVLLLDEHTAALDPKMQQVLMEYTAHEVKAHAMTTLMVTHKLEDAVRYGDRLLVLQRGRIVLDVCGTEKQQLTVAALLRLFYDAEKAEAKGCLYDD